MRFIFWINKRLSKVPKLTFSFIKFSTVHHMVFFTGCTDDAATSACAIDITHNSLGTGQHYEGYNAWAEGDTKLDW